MAEEKARQQTLSLHVVNGNELESGRTARCLFTGDGDVGHGSECHWPVQDLRPERSGEGVQHQPA